MTDRIKGLARSPRDGSRFLKWKNTSGETIPAYACVKLDAYDETDDFYNAVKPDGDGSLHFVNGPVPVAVNAYGGSEMWDQSLLGKTDSTTFGETVGPTSGSWEMTTGGSGWTVFSTPADGVAALLKQGGGGGGSVSIWFTIDSVLCPERDGVTETTLVVTVITHTGACGTEAPGADSYGIYHVYAFCDNDLSGLTEGDLIGSKGKATYDPSANTCEGRYMIDFLCAAPQCG